MKREDIKVGNIVTLDDGRKARITLVHTDFSFECDFVKDEIQEVKDEIENEKQEIKNEEKETIKAEAKKEAPKKAAKQTKPVRKTKK